MSKWFWPGHGRFAAFPKGQIGKKPPDGAGRISRILDGCCSASQMWRKADRFGLTHFFCEAKQWSLIRLLPKIAAYAEKNHLRLASAVGVSIFDRL
jgi:hypothetical protein